MSDTLFLLTICLILGTILLIFGFKYVSAALQSRSQLARENAYRELAEKAVTCQSENAASLASIGTELSEMKTRLAAIEKVLKDVE
jgi:Tfp pilus assembly protein PilO